MSLSQIAHGDSPKANVEQGNQAMLRLLEELDDNRQTARLSSGTKLVPLKTEAWDASQGLIRTLSPRLRAELESAYSDIALLNQLAWLASEFHRSSRPMLAQYVNLSLVIARKLDHIVESPRSDFSTA